MKFQKRLRVGDQKNYGAQSVGLFGPRWRDSASQATPVGVDKSVGAVAPIVDRKSRDVAVLAAVPFLVSTLSMQTDGQVKAVATAKPSYSSLAT